MKKISVLSVKVGEAPGVISIDNTLEVMQALVGGYIQAVPVSNDIYLVVNESGMIDQLPVNFAVAVQDGYDLTLRDNIHGNAFFVSALGEDFASLDKIQMNRIKSGFSFNRKILVV